MSFSEEAIAYAGERCRSMIDTQCRIPVRATTPIGYYYKTSDSLLDDADHYYKNRQWEESFILYSRYVILFIDELKAHHPHFTQASPIDQQRVRQLIHTKALPRAEELKKVLKEKYAREYELHQKAIKEANEKNATAPMNKPTTNFHNENENMLEQLKTNYAQAPQVGPVMSYPVPDVDRNIAQTSKEPFRPSFDRAQKPVTNSNSTNVGSLRSIMIPNDITAKFLQVAQRNTEKQIETCGILAGNKRDNRYVITHIVVPKQNGGPDSCDTEKEEEMLEYIFNHDLITLGWIHTHPTQTAFLSSVDLHTHLPYQMLLPEAIAVVISPKYNETLIFSLTPDVGISTISTCRKVGFHEHLNVNSIYMQSPHTSHDPGLQCQMIDLRN